MANNVSVQSTTGAQGDPAHGDILLDDINNMSAATASTSFLSYSEYNGTNNNFRLLSTASTLIGKGTNLTAYGITTDFSGNTRPVTGNWDIGPFQYSSGVASNTPPTVSAISLNPPDVDTNMAGLQVYAGTAVQLSATATAPNGDALTWQWLYSLNGGSQTAYQSGSGTAPTASFTYPLGTAGDTYVWTLKVTDGVNQLSAQSQLSLSVDLQPPPGFHLAN